MNVALALEGPPPELRRLKIRQWFRVKLFRLRIAFWLTVKDFRCSNCRGRIGGHRPCFNPYCECDCSSYPTAIGE